MRIKKRSQRTGIQLDDLLQIRKQSIETTKYTYIQYNEAEYYEQRITESDLPTLPQGNESVVWLNIDGLEDVHFLQALGEQFNIHPLTLEDIFYMEQRPKAEDFEHYIYLVCKMIYYDEIGKKIEVEQISFVLGKNYVLSFQADDKDLFEPLRERIRTGKGRLRTMNADYLAYSLLDAIVDNYFVVLEKVGEQIEAMEDILIVQPTYTSLQTIHHLRQEMIMLRRAVWPLREVVRRLEKSETAFIERTSNVYLRDVYDNIVQIIDTTEIYRETLSVMLDLYLSSINNKMNEVMKVLTIIATLFIPLTFITSLYGMNFAFMPELQWRYSYPVVLLGMLFIATMLLFYFKRKGWL